MGLKRMLKDTACWRFTNTKPGKYIKFIILLALDIVDVVVDWVFFAKVNSYQPGLVYGPPEPAIKWTVLGFCIVSTLGFLIETLQNVDDLLASKRFPFLTQSVTNFLVIFFEDMPLLILNLMITMCNDGNPSVISVIKASVGIAAVVIRLFLIFLIRWLFDSKKSRCEFIFDLLSTLGIVVVAGIAIAIQLLNNFPTNSNGLVEAHDPGRFSLLNYASDKYLRDVGVYARWPLDESILMDNLSPSTTTIATTTLANNSISPMLAPNYIWLAEISDIIKTANTDKGSIQIQVRTDYAFNMENYTLCVTKVAFERVQNCFLVQNATYASRLDTAQVNMSADSVIANNGYDLILQYRAAQENKFLIGYIDYNLNRLTQMSPNKKICLRVTASSILYARYPDYSKMLGMNFMKINSSGGFQFYDYDNDLLTVDKFWRTGIVRCRMSGDLGPKLNSGIKLAC
jgi:hypothetical protein